MNLTLTRQIAVFQARIQLLDAASDALTDLSDMQVHRKLKADVEDYIFLKSSKGEIPANPLQHTSAELARIDAVLAKAYDFYMQCLSLESELEKPQPLSLTQRQLVQSRQKIVGSLSQLSARLAELARGFSQVDWNSKGELPPELLFVADTIHPDLKLHKLPRTGLFQFAKGSGPLYDEIQRHFKHIKTRCEELLRLREEHAAVVKKAIDDLSQGNFLSAKKETGSLERLFADVGYDEVVTKCGEWQKPLDDLNDRFAGLRAEVLPMTAYPSCFAPPFLIRWAMEQKLQQIASFEGVLTEYKATIADYAKSDFTFNANQTIVKLLIDSRNLADEVRGIGRRLSKKATALRCALAMTISALVLLGGVYLWGGIYAVMRSNTRLFVLSNPPGAKVLIDGNLAAEHTPVLIRSVRTGQRHVMVQHDDYLDKELSVIARLGRSTKVEVELERDPVVVAREREQELALQKEKEAARQQQAEQERRAAAQQQAEQERRAAARQQQVEQERRAAAQQQAERLAQEAMVPEERKLMYLKVAAPGNVYDLNYTPSDGSHPRHFRIQFTEDDILGKQKLIAKVTDIFDNGSSGFPEDCVPQLVDYKGHGFVLFLDRQLSSTPFSESDIRLSKEVSLSHSGYVLEFRGQELYLIDKK